MAAGVRHFKYGSVAASWVHTGQTPCLLGSLTKGLATASTNAVVRGPTGLHCMKNNVPLLHGTFKNVISCSIASVGLVLPCAEKKQRSLKYWIINADEASHATNVQKKRF